MKYLNAVILIFSLVFALPVWSEESDLGFNFEEMENLNILLCTDANNKNNKKAFAISKNKDGTYDVFSDKFGLVKLTEVEKNLILNIPEEATMLLFNKKFTEISGLLTGESFKAACFDITTEIGIFTEYLSKGAFAEIVRLTEELRQEQSKFRNASNHRDNLFDMYSASSVKLKLKKKELIESGKKTKELKNALKRNGVYEEYPEFFNGNVNSNGKIQVRAHYKNGQLNGIQKIFDEDGSLNEYKTYKAGMKYGFYCDLQYYHRTKEISSISVHLFKYNISVPVDAETRKEGLKLCKAEYDKPTHLNYRTIKVLKFDEAELKEQKEKSIEAQLETEVLFQQVATLQKQLGLLQDLLDAAA
ncbi:hypothetical protein N8128_06830, partial [Paracoccaceae bacterium]|nr:hypothetical protein [Paracoccaceae bacterium]